MYVALKGKGIRRGTDTLANTQTRNTYRLTGHDATT